MRPVLEPDKVVLNGAQKFLLKGAVHVLKHFERKCCRVMSLSEGRCFGSGGACQDDGHCSGIGRGHDRYCQEGPVYGGGEGEVPERAASKVFANGRRVRAEELVKGVDCGVRHFANDLWYCGVLDRP